MVLRYFIWNLKKLDTNIEASQQSKNAKDTINTLNVLQYFVWKTKTSLA